MLISAEIAESDPNFRNCSQYRKSQLFRNCLYANPSLNETVSGMKQSKDHVTILFTCNTTGNEKLHPLFIH